MRKKPAGSSTRSTKHQLSSIAAHLMGSGSPQLNRVNGESISKKDEILLREAEAEFKRKGPFSLIFPSIGSNSYR